MKIAVTYDKDTETVFQHFGQTKFFKVYDINENEIEGYTIYSTEGIGHEALATGLYELGVDTLICGGLGLGAQAALQAVNIKIIPGIEGDADNAVFAYLDGDIVEGEANCSHHEHEEGHVCHCHDEEASEEQCCCHEK